MSRTEPHLPQPAPHLTQPAPPRAPLAVLRRELTLVFLAVGFLTRLPVPPVRDFEPAMLSRAALYFPLVGVLVGAISVLAWRVASIGLPHGLAVGLAMAVSLLVTGAFHEDGFADACDGFGGGVSRERVLEIMKDSRIGAFGAIGIAMMLGLRWTALTDLPAQAFAIVVIGAHAVSRWCACGLIATLRYARDGDSKTKPVAKGLGVAGWACGGLIAGLALLAGFRAADAWPGPAEWRVLGASLAAAAIVTLGAGVYFSRRIGGYTGDCLGAAQQLSELGFLVAAVALLHAPGVSR